eukprot:Filipodium_phascolosomae@DN673_c0_g1_i1.p1
MSSSEGSSSRKYDVILWGGSSFTGKLAVEYLHEYYPLEDAEGEGRAKGAVKWAVGGRNEAKIRAHLDSIHASPDVLIGDSSSEADMKRIAKDTISIVTAAGPYLKVGKALLKACVEEGTNYVDLSGEIPFITDSIKTNHETAKQKKIKIVHCSGNVSLPADVAVMVAAKFAKREANHSLGSTSLYMREAKEMTLSGGTLASIMTSMQHPDFAEQASNHLIWTNPTFRSSYSLSPSLPWGIGFDSRLWCFTYPSGLAGVNIKNIFRSHYLRSLSDGTGYGKDFNYTEGVALGCGPVSSLWNSCMAMAKNFVMSLPFVATIMFWGYQPGMGMSKIRRDRGSFEYVVLAKTVAANASKDGAVVKVSVGSRMGDVGYKLTGVMMTEMGITMAKKEYGTPEEYGVVTPSVAGGDALVRRLRGHGFWIRPSWMKAPSQ